MRGDVELHERTVLQGLNELRNFSLTVVFGTLATMRPFERVHPFSESNSTLLYTEMQSTLRAVTWTDHCQYLLHCCYESLEEVESLEKIPVKPVSCYSLHHRLQNLANAVDSGDLYTTFGCLRSLGGLPPRLSNVLVGAHMSSDSSSVQFAGEEAVDQWLRCSKEKYLMERGQGVLMEQRLMSLLTLAWRRRHHFVYLTLHKYDLHAKSGMLRYLFSEHVIRKNKLRDSLPRFPNGLLQTVIGYMTPFYPHPLDMEPIMTEATMLDKHVKAFENRSNLVQGCVLSEESTRETFTDHHIRLKLEGQFIPSGEVYKPYDAHGGQNTPISYKAYRY
jgi:hypothetical protein